MPGSAGDPVRLDHYQNIIEVGWPGKYLALRIEWTWSADLHGPFSCTGWTLGLPPWDFGSQWRDNLAIAYNAATPALAVSKRWATSNNGESWNTVDAGDIAVTGLPAPNSPTAPGAWEVADDVHVAGGGTGSARTSLVRVWQNPDSGADYGIALPELGGNFRRSVLTSQALVAYLFTGAAPTCWFHATVDKISLKQVDIAGGRQIVHSDVFDFSGCEAVFDGRTYVAAGQFLLTGGPLEDNQAQQSYLLMKPKPAD